MTLIDRVVRYWDEVIEETLRDAYETEDETLEEYIERKEDEECQSK